MRRGLKVTSLAAGMVVAGALGASAAVIDFDTNLAVISGTGTVDEFPGANPLVREFTFEGNAPFFAYLDVTVSRQFSIMLEDYQPSFSGTAQSVFSIQNLGTLAYLTNSGTCTTSNAIPALDAPGNKCDSVNGSSGTAGNPPPLSYSGLDAGTYRIGFFESGDPTRVQADFRVSAVPVPAAGFLLVGALGGLAALRRRKKAAAAA